MTTVTSGMKEEWKEQWSFNKYVNNRLDEQDGRHVSAAQENRENRVATRECLVAIEKVKSRFNRLAIDVGHISSNVEDLTSAAPAPSAAASVSNLKDVDDFDGPVDEDHPLFYWTCGCGKVDVAACGVCGKGYASKQADAVRDGKAVVHDSGAFHLHGKKKAPAADFLAA